MKVLLSWLRELVDAPGTPEEIAATMSVRGFAVEGIEHSEAESRRSAEGAEADAVIDFEVTGNRPDCMSVVGMAREIATAFERPLNPLQIAERGPGSGIQITIDAPDLCGCYVGAVADVRVGPSPDWLQARLRAGGIRPISNIVDVTNYVLLELGQPMHAFDTTRLGGGQIRVRTARAGERITTLDGQERELSPEMLVIADAGRPVAVAGVMGGADSEVDSQTTSIVFESAYFDPLSVRRTSRALGLKTEASMRFERGVDRLLPKTALLRACALLEQIGAGTAQGPIVAGTLTADTRTIALRRDRITGLLGVAVPDAAVARILESLGFTLAARPDGWSVTVPPRRVDVTREVDLVEEVARHHGFDKIPSTFPALRTAPPPMDPRIVRARELRNVLTGAGFNEAVTFGFMSRADTATYVSQEDVIPIANPLSESFAVLRPSLLPGLINAVSHNWRHEQRDIRLFEIGNYFSQALGERRGLACAWAGTVTEHWSEGARDVDFFDTKAIVDRIGDAMRVKLTTEACNEDWMVAGRGAAIIGQGTRVGVVGQLGDIVGSFHGLPIGAPLYLVHLDLELLEQIAPSEDVAIEPLPRYPSVVRDVSILIDEQLEAMTIRTTITQSAGAILEDVREFDRYQGKGVPEGKISLSLRLTFRSPERTLTDAEVQRAMDDVLSSLKERHGAVQR